MICGVVRVILTLFTRYYGLENTTADEQEALWNVLSGQLSEAEALQRFDNNVRWRGLLETLWDAAARRIAGRKFVTSQGGFVGIGVPKIEKGDIVVYLFGMHCPLVLRTASRGEGYIIVGFIYVSGLMDLDLIRKHDDKGVFKHLETTIEIY